MILRTDGEDVYARLTAPEVARRALRERCASLALGCSVFLVPEVEDQVFPAVAAVAMCPTAAHPRRAAALGYLVGNALSHWLDGHGLDPALRAASACVFDMDDPSTRTRALSLSRWIAESNWRRLDAVRQAAAEGDGAAAARLPLLELAALEHEVDGDEAGDRAVARVLAPPPVPPDRPPDAASRAVLRRQAERVLSLAPPGSTWAPSGVPVHLPSDGWSSREAKAECFRQRRDLLRLGEWKEGDVCAAGGWRASAWRVADDLERAARKSLASPAASAGLDLVAADDQPRRRTWLRDIEQRSQPQEAQVVQPPKGCGSAVVDLLREDRAATRITTCKKIEELRPKAGRGAKQSAKQMVETAVKWLRRHGSSERIPHTRDELPDFRPTEMVPGYFITAEPKPA
ncbi:MAG: hypothetical protein M9894_32575 [Planctomycetes bacterium]|nr:hypothetical protein [Planctomycetota bacterium]